MMDDIRDEVQVTIDRQLNSKKSKMISEKFNQVVEGVPEECRSIQYERQSLQSMGESDDSSWCPFLSSIIDHLDAFAYFF